MVRSVMRLKRAGSEQESATNAGFIEFLSLPLLRILPQPERGIAVQRQFWRAYQEHLPVGWKAGELPRRPITSRRPSRKPERGCSARPRMGLDLVGRFGRLDGQDLEGRNADKIHQVNRFSSHWDGSTFPIPRLFIVKCSMIMDSSPVRAISPSSSRWLRKRRKGLKVQTPSIWTHLQILVESQLS
jgi:hypothetical protein